MKIDNGKVSASQFMFTVACFIQASTLLTAFFISVTKQDSWIVSIFGFLVGMIFMILFQWSRTVPLTP